MSSRSKPLSPQVEGTRYSWRFGEVSFEVDAARGARITAFRIGTENILIGPEVNALNFGSTFWTSPQSQWGWPPIAEIDSAAYAVTGEGASISFHGRPDDTLGIAVTKRFNIDADRETVAIEYIMENRATTPRTVAPWEVSRLPIGGLTFFPIGAGIQSPSNLAVAQSEGAIWFHYDPASIRDDQKMFAHGAEGWVAHVDIARRMLLVKTFPEIAPSDQAPGEAVVEIYADPAHTYIELEGQGAHREIAPGAQTSWAVTWRLRRLPMAIRATVGNKDLLALVRAMATSSDRRVRTRRTTGRLRPALK